MLYAPIMRTLALCLALSACQNTSPPKVAIVETNEVIQPSLKYDTAQFKLVAVPSVEDIFTLSEEHKNIFLSYYHSPNNADVKGHIRIFNFLDDKLVNFDYYGKTYSANDTVENDAGNCLSLAIYTTALANLVGIEKTYRRVNSAPIYQRFHNVLTMSSHVKTILDAPDDGIKYFLSPSIIIDYFPQRGNVGGQPVTNNDFISMFYQNLAGDELVNENYDLAYSLLQQALKLSPENPNTLNTLAVLYKTVGRDDQAEIIYKFAMENTKGSVNVISNYIVLLEQQSRIQEARSLERKIGRIDDDNPYRWLDIANDLFSRAEFERALHFYKRAVDVGPYMHEGHFALAKTYYQLGEIENAEKAMKVALRYSYVPGDRDLYQAKLSMLENNDSSH